MSEDNRAEWTVMINFAADNDLSGFATTNLTQMLAVTLTDQVHVVAQADLLDESIPTQRFTFKKTGGWDPESVPEANTGDPLAFVDFVKWAVKKHKAKKYLLVLWGHGSGADDSPENESIANSTVDVEALPSVKKKSIVDLVAPALVEHAAPVLPADLGAVLTSGPTVVNDSTLTDIGLMFTRKRLLISTRGPFLRLQPMYSQRAAWISIQTSRPRIGCAYDQRTGKGVGTRQ